MPVQREQAIQAIDAFLRALGRDPAREPDLRGTAARVVDAWTAEILDGYEVEPAAMVAQEAIPAGKSTAGLVAVRALAVSTMCPHHLLPARGTADVLYWPGTRLIGLGAIGRLVDAWSHRLTLQEAIGQNVVASLLDGLGARGAACRIVLSHSCLTMRGARQHNSVVETVAMGGSFEEPGPERDLALAALTR